MLSSNPQVIICHNQTAQTSTLTAGHWVSQCCYQSIYCWVIANLLISKRNCNSTFYLLIALIIGGRMVNTFTEPQKGVLSMRIYHLMIKVNQGLIVIKNLRYVLKSQVAYLKTYITFSTPWVPAALVMQGLEQNELLIPFCAKTLKLSIMWCHMATMALRGLICHDTLLSFDIYRV